MPKYVTNVEAAHKAIERAREDAEQLRRSLSEIGLHVAAADRMRVTPCSTKSTSSTGWCSTGCSSSRRTRKS